LKGIVPELFFLCFLRFEFSQRVYHRQRLPVCIRFAMWPLSWFPFLGFLFQFLQRYTIQLHSNFQEITGMFPVRNGNNMAAFSIYEQPK
jgi:hypothetical protein